MAAPDDIENALGRRASPAEILSWAGLSQEDLTPDTVIEIGFDHYGRVELNVDTPRFNLTRQYARRMGSDELYAHHDLFEVHAGFQDQGLGADMFTRQVKALTDAGFSTIETLAAGEKGEYFNGYYTWPRFGYDGPIPGRYAVNLPHPYSEMAQVSEVMATPEGRAAWKEHGGWIDVEFDLTAGSYSQRVLEEYLVERAAKKARQAQRSDEEQRKPTRPGRGQEEIELTEEQGEALDRALDRVARERAGQT